MMNFAAALAIGATLAAPISPDAQDLIIRQKAVDVSASALETPEARDRLQRKIRSAARAVCRDHRPDSLPSKTYEACYDRAVAASRQQLAEIAKRRDVAQGG